MTDSSRPMDLTSVKGQGALEIIKTLARANHQALFAGGSVRDHLLNLNPTDFDIATSATPEQVEALFKKTIPVGKQFGVILVLIHDIEYEVATFRTEGEYQDGRHPGYVEFTNAKEDALRRDFTVNGLFYDPLKEIVLDYVHGQDDLKGKVIRSIGSPKKRFDEDKLRLLRAIRFASKLGFTIERETFNQIKKRPSDILAVSHERIRDELEKIFLSSNLSMGLSLLFDSGLWSQIFHGISIEPFKAVESLEIKSLPAVLSVLLYSLSREEIDKRLRDLRFSNDLIREVLNCTETAKKLESFKKLREGEQKLIRANKAYDEIISVFSSFQSHQKASDEWRQVVLSWKDFDFDPKPLLSGEDLKKIGLPPGPQMGKLLYEIKLMQLESKIMTKSDALDWVKNQNVL